MDLVEESYRLANLLPKNETYGLINQIQRAAVSIPANIAEGHGRDHLGDYLHHLSIANGSLMELETHLLLLPRLAYLETKELDVAFNLVDQVGKMLAALSSSLKKKNR